MARCGAKFYCVVLMAAVFCGCAHNGRDQEPDVVGEQLVWQDGGDQLWLCDNEWSGIVLGDVDADSVVAGTIWHVPTMSEAEVLHELDIVGGSQRYLCKEGGVWYSFLFGGVGKITKAGTRTKYTLRPVRSVVIPKDTIILL